MAVSVSGGTRRAASSFVRHAAFSPLPPSPRPQRIALTDLWRFVCSLSLKNCVALESPLDLMWQVVHQPAACTVA